MSQRYNLFNAGYSSGAPALYYGTVQLTRQFASHLSREASEAITVVNRENEARQAEAERQLKAACDTAGQFELQVPPAPGDPAGYFTWLASFSEVFDRNFPMSRIDHYYFVFGRKCAEILANLGLACTCLHLDATLNRELDLHRKTDKCLKDNEYILFKLIAPAALLSSEPRQNFFNVLYKKLNSSFEPYRGVNVEKMSAAEMISLKAGLEAFSLEVSSGHEECAKSLQALDF